MKYNHSLRNRILMAFCVFGFILAMIYWLLIEISMNDVEDMVFENRLRNEIVRYLDRRQTDENAILPHSIYIKSYIGFADMPKVYKDMAARLPEGLYETNGPGGIEGPAAYHLAIKIIPGQNELLYLFFDVGTLKIMTQFESIMRPILFFTTLIVTGIGGLLGLLIVKRVIAPVTELSNQIAKSGPDNLPMEISRRFADDEIGFLARTLEQSMQRIHALIQREKEFTRDASHELRTPVTVIKGAIELIAKTPAYQEQSLQRPVKRIERSVKGMAVTIDTFLWLAREDAEQDKHETCDVAVQVREAFTEHQYLFRDKKIRACLHENDAPVINAPAAVFKIVINNLLRNAFCYTRQGKISVTINAGGVEVFNTGFLNTSNEMELLPSPGLRENNGGFGFGLAIVKRLCDRFGWQLDIRDNPLEGTFATLNFSSAEGDGRQWKAANPME